MKIFIPNYPDASEMTPLTRTLTRIQICYIPDSIFLVTEDWDWFVVLQCLQDHHLFKSNPKRPPIKAFVQWLNDNGVPQLRTHFNPYQLSLASRQLRDDRFPWSNTACNTSILRRWRVLYNQLSNMLQPLQPNYHSTQNFV